MIQEIMPDSPFYSKAFICTAKPLRFVSVVTATLPLRTDFSLQLKTSHNERTIWHDL